MGVIEDVIIERVTAQSENGFFISGQGENNSIRNVVLNDIELVIQQSPYNNGTAPFYGPCRAHNYWPTTRDGAGGRLGIAAPIDGGYVEYADLVTVEDLGVTFVGEPKQGNVFGKCMRAVNSSRVSRTGGWRCTNQNTSST